MVKNLPAMRETWVRSLGWEDPLGEGMATLSKRQILLEEAGGTGNQFRLFMPEVLYSMVAVPRHWRAYSKATASGPGFL